jgi:cytochrome c556
MKFRTVMIASALLLLTSSAIAQEMPPEYQQVLKTVGKTGDYKASVLKVNIPRNDIHVTP